MIAQVNGDPWIDAWGKLKACIRSGASEQEATEYARELGRGLPDACDPVANTQQADAVQWIVRETLS
ncbi:MAG TPA: hypothetical protein VE645_13210 [Pseudonocardiaceae bacterium]|jgi:hypothetical protein|nr:hypothetical protein [Pseudonocardiaceae bacterium]